MRRAAAFKTQWMRRIRYAAEPINMLFPLSDRLSWRALKGDRQAEVEPCLWTLRSLRSAAKQGEIV